MKRVLACITIITFLVSSIPIAYSAGEARDISSFMDYIISHVVNDPVQSIELGEMVAEFAYDDGNRTAFNLGSLHRVFNYCGSKLIRQTDGNVIDFIYDNGVDCSGIVYNGVKFTFIFDEVGSVVGMVNEAGQIVCNYHYEGASVFTEILSQNLIDRQASLSNPIRYQSWYYDIETSLYYLGEGVYYDPSTEQYIQNPYYCDSRDGEPSIVQIVSNDYIGWLSSSSYGAGSYSFPSQADWSSGDRWYDGMHAVELMARCVFAENNGTNRQNDRKAVGLVIRNRVAQGFPHPGALLPVNIVKHPSAFATVNPTASYSSAVSNTAISRSVMNKTNQAFKQATFIACSLYHTTSYDDYSLLVGIPQYMTSTHTHFMSVNYAYGSNQISVSTSGGVIQWKIGSTNIYGVCISGTAELTSFYGTGTNALQTYYNNGYNVFYKYSS